MDNELTIVKEMNPSAAANFIHGRKEVMEKILTKDDIQNIQGRDFKKKSFWRKLAGVFGVSVEIVKEWREDDTEGHYTYFMIARAHSPNNNLFMDGSGACTNNEKGKIRTIHDTRGTAETRAKNRAISDMLAFGEVSADEITDDVKPQKRQPVKINNTDRPNSLNEVLNKEIAEYITVGYIKTDSVKEIIKKINGETIPFMTLTDEKAQKVYDEVIKIVDEKISADEKPDHDINSTTDMFSENDNHDNQS